MYAKGEDVMASPSSAGAPKMPEHDAGELIGQIQDLQRRVLALEQRIGESALRTVNPQAATAGPAPTSAMAVGRPSQPNVLPAAGRVLLAVAGAYILRTLTDFGAMPRNVGVALGIVYALLWLFIAARPHLVDKLPIGLTSATSMIILAPLLWEASERQQVMPGWASAGVLTAFALIALTLSWRRRQIIISGIVSASATLTAAALLLATRDLFPFTLALLGIAAAMEFAACWGHQTGSRGLSAVTADVSVLVFSWLMSRGAGLPEGYAPTPVRAVLAAQLLLILIYITMAVTQSVFRRRTLTFPETAQTASALLIGMGGIVWVFRNNGSAMLSLGICGLVGGLACYTISFLLFDRADKWNFRAWSTFGLFLVLAGTFLPFSGSGFWLLWSACAIACCWLAMGSRRPTLGLHGGVYLTLAAAVSGAASQPLWALFGAENLSFQWLVSIGVLAAATASWAAIAMSSPGEVARWRKQTSSLVIAANITWMLSGMAAHSLIVVWRAATGGWSDRIPADTLGTVVVTTFSIALAWAGTYWRKAELVWLVYGFMALGAWKLATRDFVHERNLALVVSLLFYGSALILLPRILPTKSIQAEAECSPG